VLIFLKKTSHFNFIPSWDLELKGKIRVGTLFWTIVVNKRINSSWLRDLAKGRVASL